MKIEFLTEKEQQEIIDPAPLEVPKEVILRRLEAEWLIAERDGRDSDMEALDRQYEAVINARKDSTALVAYERERGAPWISSPTPPEDMHIHPAPLIQQPFYQDELIEGGSNEIQDT